MKNIDIKEFYFVIIIALICTIVLFFAPDSTLLLRYQSTEVSQGQWWRIITANFTHSGWNHWLLNLSGLIMMDYLYQPTVKQVERAKLFIFCLILNVLLLHLLMNIDWYVGLSGTLHGYLVGGALLSFNKNKLFSSLILVIVTTKLFFELNWEINEFTANLIKTNVVEESHLFGAISAVIYFVLFLLYHRFIKNNKSAM